MNLYENFVGKILDERYKIQSLVGVGGMAVVFKAEDIIMKRTVAIKVLKNDSTDAEKPIKRFLNESKAVAMLSHPNIVSIYDVNVKDEIKYIVMEYVEGVTLKEHLKLHDRLGWKEAIRYTVQILRALSHAHSKGLVHCDIKPQNILLLENGSIKVADFGIAKLPNNDTASSSDSAIGSVHYISPEQAAGKEVSSASDIYSVGVMLYEMVTGKLPFYGDTASAIALKHIEEEPEAPKNIIPMLPDGLQFIILQAMAKSPSSRFSTCDEMIEYLNDLIKNPDIVFVTRKTPQRSSENKHSSAKKQSCSEQVQHSQIKVKKYSNTVTPVIFGVFLAFLLVLSVSGIIVFKTFWNATYGVANSDEDANFVVVEKLVGKEYTEELAKELDEKGYRVTLVDVYSDIYAKNVIAEQNVHEGSKRRYGFSIKLSISKGVNSFKLSDYSYTEYREANRAMKSLGLTVKIVQQKNDFVASGFVINTVPAPESVVAAGDTVTLYVSDGPDIEYIEVPNLCVKPLSEAEALLKENDLELGEIKYSDSDLPEGYVISQSVGAGASAPKKYTVIDLEVSNGKSETEVTENESEM